MATIVAAGATGLYQFSRKDNNHGYKVSSVFAATAGDFPAAQFLQATDGGMAQYGYALEQSTSPSATLQALAEWNSHVNVAALSPVRARTTIGSPFHCRRKLCVGCA